MASHDTHWSFSLHLLQSLQSNWVYLGLFANINEVGLSFFVQEISHIKITSLFCWYMFSFVFEFLISDNEKELQLNIYNKTKRDVLCCLLFYNIFSKLHKRPDGCWSCVEFGNLISINNIPEAARVRIERSTFKLYTRNHDWN